MKVSLCSLCFLCAFVVKENSGFGTGCSAFAIRKIRHSSLVIQNIPTSSHQQIRIMKSLFFVILIIPLFSFVEMNFSEREYIIEEGSKLYLQGSSNVNQFRCDCDQKFSKNSFVITNSTDGKTAAFQKAVLHLPSKSLDCGNNGINKDMYKTLRADEFPNIQIKLSDIEFLENKNALSTSGDWVRLKANVVVTIAGVSKKTSLMVKAKSLGADRFHFIAQKDLLLSDFKLTPPSPLFGLIKVNDQVTIHLDLITKVI